MINISSNYFEWYSNFDFDKYNLNAELKGRIQYGNEIMKNINCLILNHYKNLDMYVLVILIS